MGSPAPESPSEPHIAVPTEAGPPTRGVSPGRATSSIVRTDT